MYMYQRLEIHYNVLASPLAVYLDIHSALDLSGFTVCCKHSLTGHAPSQCSLYYFIPYMTVRIPAWALTQEWTVSIHAVWIIL
jgi:hypothetical protein